MDHVRHGDGEAAGKRGEEMTADAYVQSVIDNVPRNLPLRDQIAKELGAHIAERMQHGQPLDDVLRNLGDPLKLAESYLAAEPLKSAPFWPRAMAKIVDFAIVLGVAVPFGFAFPIYTALGEYESGWTVGKRLMGIRGRP